MSNNVRKSDLETNTGTESTQVVSQRGGGRITQAESNTQSQKMDESGAKSVVYNLPTVPQTTTTERKLDVKYLAEAVGCLLLPKVSYYFLHYLKYVYVNSHDTVWPIMYLMVFRST